MRGARVGWSDGRRGRNGAGSPGYVITCVPSWLQAVVHGSFHLFMVVLICRWLFSFVGSCFHLCQSSSLMDACLHLWVVIFAHGWLAIIVVDAVWWWVFMAFVVGWLCGGFCSFSCHITVADMASVLAVKNREGELLTW